VKDDFIDALRYSMGLSPYRQSPYYIWSFDMARKNEEAVRQKGLRLVLEAWDEYAARQTKGKTMLDTSKKYKVGSVVYKLHFPGAGVWRDEGVHKFGIINPVMQQLYDDGLAVEVKEPFKKTFKVEFDHLGLGRATPRAAEAVRKWVTGSFDASSEVANRTFDVTIKERL